MSDELIGQSIKGYEIQSIIGQGGMATVYLARQQSMDRFVALKMLPLNFAQDDMYLQRFEREVRIVSQLEHRNIVPVYDYGEYQDKQPYIVMRYMPAGSVDDALQAERVLLPDKILDIIAQVAPALDYAHTKGVLHRDLKPSNILLDEAGGAFITDFGIARIIGAHTATITTQGVVGTPSYMSPEQAQGHELDGRSDVYALGVMLFEMATGRRPFESETPYSIAVMQVTQQPPAPRSYHPGLSMAIESVILKALHKNPDERYQTAVGLYEALKMAIERPDSVFDTEPNLSVKAAPRADDTQPRQPTPAPVSPLPQPSVPAGSRPRSAAISYPNHAFVTPYPKRKHGLNPLLGVMLGGLLGCGLLTGIALLAYFVLIPLLIADEMPEADPTQLLPDTSSSERHTATPSPTMQRGIPTLDPTSEAYRQTLVARTASAAQTTAEVTQAVNPAISSAEATPDAPMRPSDVAPVGLRGTPDLNAALRAARGRIVYSGPRAIGDARSYEIMLLQVPGLNETQLTSDLSDNIFPGAAPDGRFIAFQSDRGDDGDDVSDFDIYVVNRGGGQLRALTDNAVDDQMPAWSPDGEWLVYASDTHSNGALDLYRVRVDGTQRESLFSSSVLRASQPRYHPNGESIVFTVGEDPGDARTWDIAVLDLASNSVNRLTSDSRRDAAPAYSPDGSQILYTTFNGQDNAIAIMDADGGNQRILYDSSGNDYGAAFSPDGNYIVFASDLGVDLAEGSAGRSDQLYLMSADGENVQQLTSAGGLMPDWVP
jgi:serine/threonine protein kinase/Tol biopolymer transport system component